MVFAKGQGVAVLRPPPLESASYESLPRSLCEWCLACIQTEIFGLVQKFGAALSGGTCRFSCEDVVCLEATESVTTHLPTFPWKDVAL